METGIIIGIGLSAVPVFIMAIIAMWFADQRYKLRQLQLIKDCEDMLEELEDIKDELERMKNDAR